MRTAVLLMMYNRPDLAAVALDRIRIARPSRLYLAADGPRRNDSVDVAQCLATRSAVATVDWPAKVRTLYRQRHLGCTAAVTGAIDWFMSHEREGIIVEDDCWLDSTFFSAADELLERYRFESNVALIGASNFAPNADIPTSYFFSRLVPVWGWATWRRSWSSFHRDMHHWPEYRCSADLAYFGTMQSVVERLLEDAFAAGHLAPWGTLWRYHCLRNQFLSIVFKTNLVTNMGFGRADATRHKTYHPIAEMPVQPLSVPLVHPSSISPARSYDCRALEYYYRIAQRE